MATVVRSVTTYTLGRLLIPRQVEAAQPVVLEEESHFEGISAIAPPESAA